jgi:hypothetical protein
VITAAGETTRAAVKGASDTGRDVALVARGAVEGTIEAATEIGGNVGGVAKAAAVGAVEAAGAVGAQAVRTVRDLLVGVAGGFKDVLAAILPKKAEGEGEVGKPH